MQEKNPPYRTLFSMACLAITVQAAGFVYLRARRRARARWRTIAADVARPLIGAATAYFVCNTLLIAVAIGLSTRQPVLTRLASELPVECAELLRRRRRRARAPPGRCIDSGIWIALLLAAPLYLTYYTYKVYLGRIDDERRHVQEMADLHLATIEALALAIDAKDQTAQAHIRRVQVYAAGLARALGMPERRDPGRQDRRAAARHRQARGARAHPVQAGPADAGRVPEDPRPPAGGRRDHQRRAVPVSGRAADPEPPRAVGRQGLSAAASRAKRSRSARGSCRSSITSTR